MSKLMEHNKYGGYRNYNTLSNSRSDNADNNTNINDKVLETSTEDAKKTTRLPARYQKILDKYNLSDGKPKKEKQNRKQSRSSTTPDSTNTLDVIDRSYSNAVIEFFEDSTIQEITSYLHQFLFKRDACDKNLGEGAIGFVVQKSIGDTFRVNYSNDVSVDVPVIVKEVHVENEMYVNYLGGELFISNSRGISVEALLLYFIKPLIVLKLSPHLPLILDHGKCILREIQPVDRIVLERHGLPEEIDVDIKGLYESPMWRHLDKYDPHHPVYSTRLSTFDDLTVFMHLTKDSNYNVTLPNDEVCSMVELLDCLSISYLVTYDLLFRHNIYLLDMHPQNILIHWLNKQSYLQDQYIGDTKYIFYKVGDKMYKIKTFGLLLKIGDVGASIAHPKKDVYLVGQAYDIQQTQNIVREIAKTNKCHDFLNFFSQCVPLDLFRKTVAYKIMTSDPYDKIMWISQDRELFNRMLPVPELLKAFDKYSVDKIDEKSNYLVF